MAEVVKEEAKPEAAATQPEEKVEEKAESKGEELPESVRKAIQSEVDRVRTKYVQEKKKLETELEEVRKEKMTAEERAKYDQQKAKEDLNAERRQVEMAKLELFATKALTEKGIEIEAMQFVIADSQEAVEARLAALDAYLKKREKAAIDGFAKGTGRTVQQTFAGTQNLYTLAQLKTMSEAQIREIMSTPEGEKRITDSMRAAR